MSFNHGDHKQPNNIPNNNENNHQPSIHQEQNNNMVVKVETRKEEEQKSKDGINEKWSENLPSPPIPDLRDTLERYLAGLKPVIPSAQFETTRETIKEFLYDGEGERLQKLLTEYAKQRDNWVTDFWLDDMYLTNPIPLVINSNPYFLLPKQTFDAIPEMISYASVITHFALNFKEQIDRETLNQDIRPGYQKLCMKTYRHFFTACRIPGLEKDELKISKNGQHFIVAAFEQFTVVHLKPDEVPSIEELNKCLWKIWNRSKETKNTAPVSHVGILTTENRRTWAKIRREMRRDKTNEESLDWIENSLFILCLDNLVLPKKDNKTRAGHRDSIQMAKKDASYLASTLLHGAGSNVYTSNRWFDKFLQIIISKEGICGLIVEHSASEGITVINFLERFLEFQRQYYSNNHQNETSAATIIDDNLIINPLRWKIDTDLNKHIKQAEKQVDRLISDLELCVFEYVDYGREYIKKQKISPDVYIQLALQLTYFKMHGMLVSTYESCSLRQFKHGRVDNIRSSTMEALEWARSLGDKSASEEQRINLFKKAIEKQTEILQYTSSGYGPDNHLVALREISKIHLNTVPKLFMEKSYKEYINYRLSTSQLFTKENIIVGYGPVVSDGYGCSYMPKNDRIVFCVTSFYESAITSSDFFTKSLEMSLNTMKETCMKMASLGSSPTTNSNNNIASNVYSNRNVAPQAIH